ARGVTIEPVHEAGFFALLVAPGFQHAIHVAVDARAALDGKAGGLIEDEDLIVLVDQHLGQHVAIALRTHGAHGRRRCALAIDTQRRHTDHLPRLDPAIGLHATAIDTHLTGAQKLLQLTEGKPRIMNLEPAIQAHARFAVFYRNLF